MRGIFCVLTFIISANLFSAVSIIGTVKKSKGQASVLFPHSKMAKVVNIGMKLPADSSIVTKRRSIVVIEYFDKSKITVGPNSKVIVSKINGKSKGVVNLLKGKIRAVIKKSKTGQNSFYIKSRTAAMGVRGTTFQTTYNSKNKITTLVTIEGKVALKKIKNRTKIIKDKNIDEVLKSSVEVGKGEISFVTKTLKKETVPVHMSPRQFSIIKMNVEFAENPAISKEALEKEIKDIEKEFAKAKIESAIAIKIEGRFNSDSKRFHPRSGGMLDMNTGIYIQPIIGSEFDEEIKIFKAKNIGDVSSGGDYQPPRGIRLDATKGFVTKNSNDSEGSKVTTLNKQIAVQVINPIVPQKNQLEGIEDSADSAYEKYFDY